MVNVIRMERVVIEALRPPDKQAVTRSVNYAMIWARFTLSSWLNGKCGTAPGRHVPPQPVSAAERAKPATSGIVCGPLALIQSALERTHDGILPKHQPMRTVACVSMVIPLRTKTADGQRAGMQAQRRRASRPDA